jgi:signal transduction histidine kinase
MGFRVQARTIVQLGAELISSDSVAFYELIKNAFDAGAMSVRIRITSVIQHEVCNRLLTDIESLLKSPKSASSTIAKKVLEFQRDVVKVADVSTEFARRLVASVEEAATLEELLTAVEACNKIEVEDAGDGMSLETLNSVYLTIGTTSRYSERKAQLRGALSDSKVILGEKGIGRLSAMRLGEVLRVSSTRKGEKFWNDLDLDWRAFSHDSDQMLEDVEIAAVRGSRKEDFEKSGTCLTITRLTSTWTRESVERMIREEFSKLVDPFADEDRYKIFVRLNGVALERVLFEKDFLGAAHAKLTADFSIDPKVGPVLSGRIDYSRHKRVKAFSLSGTHLVTSTKADSLDQLAAVGPFSLTVFWYNRKDIDETAGSEAEYVKRQVRLWAGGVMVYRDGFRVNPYGGPDDDWLGLDKKAFASGGYKLNRNQLVGKLNISSRANPELLDQTNREGIRDSENKRSLVMMLRHVITSEFRTFLNAVEREIRPLEPLSVDELNRSAVRTSKTLKAAWTSLRARFPVIREDRNLVGQIDEAIEELTGLMDRARALVLSYDKGRGQLVQLAGIGLMVEFIGHELNRATEHALRAVVRSRKAESTADLETALDSLGTQLKTLSKRIKVLDPLGPSGRQTKERFDLSRWVRDVLSTHEDQFSRHGITASFKARGQTDKSGVWVLAVKGMITQIIENLIANAVYWLKAQKRIDRRFAPQLSMVLDASLHRLTVTDNGPGIEVERAEEVFQAFVTSKPPGEGKGLGLYIALEMARYHGCDLYLSEKQSSPGILNQFVFDFTNIEQ